MYKEYNGVKTLDIRMGISVHAQRTLIPTQKVGYVWKPVLITFCVQAQETAQLEEQLQGWGEVILAGDRVVRWEKPWFPGALMGGTTVLFLWVNLTAYRNMTLHTAWCKSELAEWCRHSPSWNPL